MDSLQPSILRCFGAMSIIPDHIDVSIEWRDRTLVKMIPHRIPDKACTNPAVWQVKPREYPEQMPAKPVGSENGGYAQRSSH